MRLADNCSLRVGTNTALFGAPTTPAATLVAPGPASASNVVISGGKVDYSSDDIPVGVTAVNGGQAVCTDPTNAPNGDLRNAWRSTVTDPSTAATFTTTDADGNPVYDHGRRGNGVPEPLWPGDRRERDYTTHTRTNQRPPAPASKKAQTGFSGKYRRNRPWE